MLMIKGRNFKDARKHGELIKSATLKTLILGVLIFEGFLQRVAGYLYA